MNCIRLLMLVAVAASVVSCNRGQPPQPAEPSAAPAAQAPTTIESAGQPATAVPAATQPAPAPARAGTTGTPRTTPEGRAGSPRGLATGSAPGAAAGGTRDTRPVYAEVTVPAGTPLHLALDTPLTTETAQIEDPVRARLRDTVVIDGRPVLPAGAILVGHVTGTERPGRVKGVARLAFRFNEIELRNETVKLNTAPISIRGEETRGEDATKIGIGAGIGAAIGAIAGGKGGAAKGAAIGGAAGTGAVVATRGKEIDLAQGAALTTRLNDPVTVQVPLR